MPMFDDIKTPEDFDILSRVMDMASDMAQQSGVIPDPKLHANDPSTPEQVAKAYGLGYKRAQREATGIGGRLVPEWWEAENSWTSLDQAAEMEWGAKSVYNPAEGCFVGPRTERPRIERAFYLGFIRGFRHHSGWFDAE